jgi:hypothetical protein
VRQILSHALPPAIHEGCHSGQLCFDLRHGSLPLRQLQSSIEANFSDPAHGTHPRVSQDHRNTSDVVDGIELRLARSKAIW